MHSDNVITDPGKKLKTHEVFFHLATRALIPWYLEQIQNIYKAEAFPRARGMEWRNQALLWGEGGSFLIVFENRELQIQDQKKICLALCRGSSSKVKRLTV